MTGLNEWKWVSTNAGGNVPTELDVGNENWHTGRTFRTNKDEHKQSVRQMWATAGMWPKCALSAFEAKVSSRRFQLCRVEGCRGQSLTRMLSKAMSAACEKKTTAEYGRRRLQAEYVYSRLTIITTCRHPTTNARNEQRRIRLLLRYWGLPRKDHNGHSAIPTTHGDKTEN